MTTEIDYYVVKVVSDLFWLYVANIMGAIGMILGIINFIDFYKRRAWTYHKKIERKLPISSPSPQPSYPQEKTAMKKQRKIKKTSGAPF